MALEYDMARVGDGRPKIPRADDIGMSRMQARLDCMRFDTDQRPVQVEAQRGPSIPHGEERFFRSVRGWRGGTILLGHMEGLNRVYRPHRLQGEVLDVARAVGPCGQAQATDEHHGGRQTQRQALGEQLSQG